MSEGEKAIRSLVSSLLEALNHRELTSSLQKARN